MSEYNIVDLIRFAHPEVWEQACAQACVRYGVFPGPWHVPGVELDLAEALRERFGAEELCNSAAKALAHSVIWAHDAEYKFERPGVTCQK